MQHFPILNNMTAEILGNHMKNSNVTKLDVSDEQIEKTEQIPKVFELLNTFSKELGLTLNGNKCELMAILTCHLTNA